MTTIQEALNALQSDNPLQRIAAIQFLSTVTDIPSYTSIPTLINQLNDPDDSVRLTVLKALGALLPAHADYTSIASRAMVRLLVQPVGTLVKTAVIAVLYQLNIPLTQILVPLMNDEDMEVVQGANAAYAQLFKRPNFMEAIERERIPFAELTLQAWMETLAQHQTIDATQEAKIVTQEAEEAGIDEDEFAPDDLEEAEDSRRQASKSKQMEKSSSRDEAPTAPPFGPPAPAPVPVESSAPPEPAPSMPEPSVPPPPILSAPSTDILTPPKPQRVIPAVEIPAPKVSESPPPRGGSMDVSKPVAEPGAPPLNHEEIQFSTYYPREIEPQKWQPMTAYVYKSSAANAIIQDAQQQLGGLIATMRRIVQSAFQTIPTGTLITATPYLKGFQFNPPHATVGFYEDWHRFDFKMRAVDAPLNFASNGFLTFTVEGIIVADIPLSVYVGDAVSASSMVTMSQKLYKSIFCSYSREDKVIIDRVERAYKALGFDFLRDVHTIKSGQDWNEQLYEMIETADIFQLFWSSSAASSEWVEKEWRYALSLDRDERNFIRPVYWEDPIPDVPPELGHIHFAFEPTLDD